jgi:hypothetical protein
MSSLGAPKVYCLPTADACTRREYIRAAAPILARVHLKGEPLDIYRKLVRLLLLLQLFFPLQVSAELSFEIGWRAGLCGQGR